MSEPLPPPIRGGLGNTFKRFITRFAVPTNAGPTVAGWVFDTAIPAELTAVYGAGGPAGLVAVQLGYTGSINSYNYVGLRATGALVVGKVSSSVVEETYRVDEFGNYWALFRADVESSVSNVRQFLIGANGIGGYDANTQFSLQNLAIILNTSTRLFLNGQVQVGPFNASADAYIARKPERATCNANTGVGIANTPLPGTSIVINNMNTEDYYIITAGFALEALVAPTAQMSGNLRIDGVVQGGSAGPIRMAAINEKQMPVGQWQITGLSVGNHTFDLSAVAGVAAQYRANAGDTYLSILPLWRNPN